MAGSFSFRRATKVTATKAQSPPSRTEFESAQADFVLLLLRFQPPDTEN